MADSGSSQRLIADLQYIDGELGSIAPGATVTTPHGLHQGNLAVKPTSVLPNLATPVIVQAADENTITVFNPTPISQSVTFRVERVHTIHENPEFADDDVPVDPPFTMLLWDGEAPTGAPVGQSLIVNYINNAESGGRYAIPSDNAVDALLLPAVNPRAFFNVSHDSTLTFFHLQGRSAQYGTSNSLVQIVPIPIELWLNGAFVATIASIPAGATDFDIIAMPNIPIPAASTVQFVANCLVATDGGLAGVLVSWSVL